jgi:hypothetical protein
MYLIHASWIPSDEKSFKSDGHFAVWVETSDVKKDGSYHLKDDELIDFFDKKLGLIKKMNAQYNKNAYYFLLPTVKQKPLSSLKILSSTNAIVPEKYDYAYWKIHCIEPEQITSFLKELYFMSLYFPSDIQLGNDVLFWHRCYQEFKEIILKDQYIPAIKHHDKTSGKQKNSKKSKEFYPAWEILSHNYEERINQLSRQMPRICGAGFITIPKEKQYFASKTLLQNFNENLLAQLISTINFTQKIHKDMENTFISGCINNPLDWLRQEWLETWQGWYTWREQLISTDTKTEFYLVFRLTEANSKSPDVWFIDLLAESKKDPSFKVTLQDYWQAKDRKKYQVLLGEEFENNLLIQLGSASRIYKNLESGLNTDHPTGFNLSLQEAYAFLREEAWVLQNAGYKIIIPSWWTPKGSQKAKLRLKSNNKKADDSLGTGFFGPQELIDFNYELSIGGEAVTEEEWQMLVNAKTPLVEFRGQWMELNTEKMESMLEFWRHNNQPKEMSLVELMKKTITDEQDFELDDQLNSMMECLWDKSEFQELKTPKTFNGKLRNYQQRGFSWLHYLEQIGMNPCLADDMGLGKTIQVLALLLHEKANNKQTKTLLIAPTSVLGNWQKETERFAPDLKAVIFHGTERSKTAKAFTKFIKDQDMVITSYTLARRDEKLLGKTNWNRIVIDEAQNIKNPSAAQTRAINKFNANNRIALTGTPIENRLLDLWSIFNFLNPGYLGTHANFRRSFEIPVQRNNNTNISAMLKKLVEPFILRRTKTDKNIIKDLPDKLEQKVYCNLTKEQGSLYQAVVQDVEEKILELDGIERKGLILSTLMKLKQICNHPSQFLQDDSSLK